MHSRIVWMKSIVLGLLIIGVSGTAFAQHAPKRSDRLDQPVKKAALMDDDMQLAAARVLLSGYHAVPTHKELENAFPEQARKLMMRIASDTSEFELHRQRAVAAVGYWPDLTVYALYSKLLHDAETSDAMKHQILGHLSRVFGDSGVADVAAFLQHEDVQYRLTAVYALGQVDSDAAQKYLKAAAASEKDEVVLERIAQFTLQVR